MNELKLSILVRNENELLWLSADNVVLVVYPIKFIFSCLSYSSRIGSGLIRFGSFRVGVYIKLIRVRVNSDSIRVISILGLIRVITVSGWFGFRSVQFWILGRNRFNSFSYRFGSDFGMFGLTRSVQITFIRSMYSYICFYIAHWDGRLLKSYVPSDSK